MTSTPLVSIITPSYNQADYLEQTIQSVLAQDYKQVEYIVIDGASSDNSPAIIQSYAEHFAFWVSEKDAGQAEAINKGLRRAKGEIVAWLNSDDIYLPGAITDAVTAFQARPETGLLFTDAISIDERGTPISKLAFGDWGLKELISFRIICQPAVFMQRFALEKAGFLDPSYHCLLDHQLWIRIARLTPIQHISGLWAAARHHAAAKNVTLAASFGREAQRILEWEQSQPDLVALITKNKRQVLAGFHRLNARYLLDGGLPGSSLREYSKALIANPGFAMGHWHRMVFAALCLLEINGVTDNIRNSRDKRFRKLLISELSHRWKDLQSWPGLKIT